MKKVTLPDQHIMLTAEADVRQIIDPVLKPFDIVSFEAGRCYDNGEAYFLASNNNITRYVFDEGV